MGYVVEVDQSNYATEVVEKSYEKLVLIDFFATWCGPCQILKPLLEKLAHEYDFILAKIDIDQNPDLANHFGIEGVPDVRIMQQGQMIPAFVGALPEAQLRDLMRNLNLKSNLEIGIEAVQKARIENDVKQAKQLLDQLFEQYPDSPGLIIEAAKFLIGLNQLETAAKMLNTIDTSNRDYFSQSQAIKALIKFKQESLTPGETELDNTYHQAVNLTLNEDYEAALRIFLEIVSTNRKYKDDGARKAMLAIFNILGDNHPLTKQYQQELMMALY